MSPSPDPSPQRFAVQVHPGAGMIQERGDGKSAGVLEAAQPDCWLEGWFLPPEGTTVTGMRLRCAGEILTVKRKQIRPDVLRQYPGRPDALQSGFKVALQVPPGTREVTLQYKDAGKEWHDIGTWQVRLSKLWRLKKLWRRHDAEDAYPRWLQRRTPDPVRLRQLRAKADQWPHQPLLSVLLTIRSDDAEAALHYSIPSLLAQAYPHWELWLTHEGAAHSPLEKMMEKAARGDRRIKVGAGGMNQAVAEAAGGHVALLGAGDALAPQALYHAAALLLRTPDADVIYTDEDAVDEHGRHHTPHFKGSWNYELQLHRPAAGDFLMLRTTLLRELGGLRTEFGGNAVWDLLLRASARLPGPQIHHLPQVLHHRGESSTPVNSGREVIAAHLAAVHPEAALQEVSGGAWRIAWPLPDPVPLVSIIIPTHNRADLLRVAMDSLFANTRYDRFEIIVVDHASDEAESLAYLQQLAAHAQVRIVRAEGPFNWSRLNNLGAAQAQGDILLFLNNDVEINQPGWLGELAAQAWRPDVGAVGACLLYPDGSLQHAGIVLGMTGLAGHIFRKAQPETETMGGSADVPREVTALTGACLAVRSRVFLEAGGFDEEHLPVSYNDVDFCLKLRAQGLRNIYTPFARLVHHESVSRRDSERESSRKAAATEEARVVLQRWPKEFAQDVFFNPNLSPDEEIPTLADEPGRTGAMQTGA